MVPHDFTKSKRTKTGDVIDTEPTRMRTKYGDTSKKKMIMIILKNRQTKTKHRPIGR